MDIISTACDFDLLPGLIFPAFWIFKMSTTGASDSSLDSSVMDSRRSCPSCSSRMSSLLYDQHKLCVTCRGEECEFNNKCFECLSWPDDIFEKYVKHRRSPLAKYKKLRGSLRASSGKYFEINFNMKIPFHF